MRGIANIIIFAPDKISHLLASMPQRLKYDISLPQKIDDILDADFWIVDPLTKLILGQVSEPIRFTNSTSIYVRRGTCRAEINLLEQKIEAPCVVNIKAGNYLMLREISDDIELACIVMSKRLADNIFMFVHLSPYFPIAAINPVISIREEHVNDYELFYSFLRRLQENKENPNPYETVLHTVLAFFYNASFRSFRKDPKGGATAATRLVDKFMTLVREHFRKEHFLEYYARELEVSPKHLSRTLKTLTGSTGAEWIEKYVLLEAKIMLRSTNLSVQNIADELNFPSQSTFGKYFKSNTGVSPKDYRNNRDL